MTARNFLGQIIFWFFAIGSIFYFLRLGLTFNSLLTEKGMYTLGFDSGYPKWKVLLSDYAILHPFVIFPVVFAFVIFYIWKYHPNSTLKNISFFIYGTGLATGLASAALFGEAIAS